MSSPDIIMASYSEKKQKQIAIHTFLSGSKSASEAFAIPETEATSLLDLLLSKEIPFFTSIRNEILSYTHQKGSKATSDFWGLSQELIKQLKKSFPVPEGVQEVADKGISIYPSDLQTTVSVSIQPSSQNDSSSGKKKKKTNEEKRKVTNYSIEQKIEAVREFVRRSNQSETARELNIPAVNLMRWRDKLRKEAFQEAHVENLYGCAKRGQRNKMFKDLDNRVYRLYRESSDKTDEKIIQHAKHIIRLDDSEPVIKDEWLTSFKRQFKLI